MPYSTLEQLTEEVVLSDKLILRVEKRDSAFFTVVPFSYIEFYENNFNWLADKCGYALTKHQVNEVVRPDSLRKLYFDIDGFVPQQQLGKPKTIKQMALEVAYAAKKAILEELHDYTMDSLVTKEYFKMIADSESSNSCHLVFRGLKLTAAEAQRLHAVTLQYLDPSLHEFIDGATAKAGFNMRVPGSYKLNKHTRVAERQLKLIEWDYQPEESYTGNDETICIEDLLITTTSLCSTPHFKVPVATSGNLCDTTMTEEGAGPAFDVLSAATAKHSELLSAFIVKAYIPDKGGNGGSINFTRIQPSHCDVCNRVHDNDNTLYARAYGPATKKTKLIFKCRKNKQVIATFMLPTATPSRGDGKVKKGFEWVEPLDQYVIEQRFQLVNVYDISTLKTTVYETFDDLFNAILSSWWWSETDGVYYKQSGTWQNVGKYAAGYSAALLGLSFWACCDQQGCKVSGKTFLTAMSALARKPASVFVDSRPYGLDAESVDSAFNAMQQRERQPVSSNYADNVEHFCHFVKGQLASSEDDRFAQHLIKWVAHLIQKPLVKTHTMPIITGSRGIGKGLFCSLLCKLIKTSTSLNSSGVAGAVAKFNAIMRNKTLVSFGELVTKGMKPEEMATLKSLITDDTAEIGLKHIDLEASSHNFLNFIGCVNSVDSIAIEAGERRFFIITSRRPEYCKTDTDYWTVTRELFASEEFINDVYCYLSDLDLNGYSPMDFPISSARAMAINSNAYAGFFNETTWEEGKSYELKDLMTRFVEYDPTTRDGQRTIIKKLVIEMTENDDIQEMWNLNKTMTVATYGQVVEASKKESWQIKPVDKMTCRELKSYIRSKGMKFRDGDMNKSILLELAKSCA